MMVYHDSRNPEYRFPLGAVGADSRVRLRVRVGEPVQKVQVRTWVADTAHRFDMTSMNGEWYEYTLPMPMQPGLLWYFFCVEATDGQWYYYGDADDGLGGEGQLRTHEPPSFQITVYGAFETPKWMRESIMMQILPDRFYRARPFSEKALGRGGWFHADWSEAPALVTSGEDRESVDFFGGDLKGIEEKLPVLYAMGIRAIYLNPIFRARSNHKYDTGDYKQIDPSLGDESDFTALMQAARALGMHIVLDGVFSHTGADSRYFNRYGTYDSIGAYQSPDSPYARWYTFRRHPDDYECWWDFNTLPNVRELEPSFVDYIIRDPDSVIAHWLRKGASGWRLDVADELPMEFIRRLRARVKLEDAEAAVIGEVWEDPSNKVAYGVARSYALGDTLDSTMNYPLRDALIRFMMNRIDAHALVRIIAHMAEVLPKPMLYAMMNLLGSHDKPRIINILAEAESSAGEAPHDERRDTPLTRTQYEQGSRRYQALWALTLALPGMPTIYYGDEVGLTGTSDPFCRKTYPWTGGDLSLKREIMRVNAIRNRSQALKSGEFQLYALSRDVVMVERWIADGRDAFGDPASDERVRVYLNRSSRYVQLDGQILPPCSTRFVSPGAR